MKCGVLAGTLLILGNLTAAVRLGLNGYSTRSSLRRRGNLSGVGNSSLTNNADVQYLTTVTIGGNPYNLLVDSGR